MSRARVLLPIGLVAALVVAVVLSAGIGQLAVPVDEVFGSVLHHLGIDLGPMPSTQQAENALWIVRFPRIVMATLVGAALGCAGAMMQGIFANPLAEPGVVGVSSGAAVGACSVIVFGGTLTSGVLVAAGAFAGGLLTTALVYLFARRSGRTEVITLVLTGVAVTAFAGGVLAFLTFVADPSARDQVVFWQLGSPAGAQWSNVAVIAPMILVSLVAAMALARQFDLLALGERAAEHVGVNVERLRGVVIVLVAVLVSAAVAFTGVIAFVGLVVPHIIRMIAGPAHRLLLPASAIGGALVLVLADLLARTVIPNADLPLGMLTSLVGGPFFFWLIRRTRIRQGGWA